MEPQLQAHSLPESGASRAVKSQLAIPANGEMGFVVSTFVQPIVDEANACPDGPSPKNQGCVSGTSVACGTDAIVDEGK